MARAPYTDKNGLRRGSWSEEEDNKLRAYILRYGHWNWRHLPRFAGLARCGKSCRLRWLNYLKPGVRRGNYTSEEDEMILRLYQEYGTRWALISSKLPGRTDNDIKNRWHTHLWRRVKHEPKSMAMTAAGETPLLLHHSTANSGYADNLSDYQATSDLSEQSDGIMYANNGAAGDVNRDEVSSFYSDPAAVLIDNIGALDWAVMAEILSPSHVEETVNPFSASLWNHDDDLFSSDTSYGNIDTFLHHAAIDGAGRL